MATLDQLEEGVRRAYTAGKMDYARILGAELVRARGDRVNQIPGMQVEKRPEPEPSLTDKAIGAGEAALSVGTGMTGGTIGMIGGTLKGLAEQILSGKFGTPEAAQAVEETAIKGAGSLTYVPRTKEGQEWTEAISEVASSLPPVLPEIPAMAAAATGAGTQAARAAERAAAAGKAAGKTVVDTVEGIVKKDTPAAGGSVGAAGVDMETLRREKAAQLPVPVKLTKGAATRNADDLSFEKEAMKGESGAPLRARAEGNNLQALQNFDTLIDQSGAVSPDLAATGNALVSTLSSGYQAAKAKTRAAYEKARNSPEADIAVDTTPVIDHLNSLPSGLKTTALSDHAKQYATILGIAEEGKDGKLIPKKATVKTMEDWRKEISQATGFEPAEIRDSTILKGLIDGQTQPVAGPLYKAARMERTAQARKYENRAIIARLVSNKRGKDDPQVPVDEVFKQTVLHGSPEELAFLKRVLKTNGKRGEAAWTEMQAETIRHIRDTASKGMGMDSADRPIISPAKLHQVITQLDANGRLDLMLGKKNAQVVRDLNEVVRYVTTVPPGTLVNTSGTAGMLMAAIAEAGATGAVTGLPVPVLSGLRLIGKGIKNAKLKARIKKALGE